MLKLVNGFKRLTDADLGVRATQIVTGMTGNPNFTAPSPSTGDVNSTVVSYFNALNACTDGDRQKIAVKQQVRDLLVDALHKWGLYVIMESGDDVAMALTSGFQIAKTPSASLPLVKPLAPILESGINVGELLSKAKPEAAAVAYLHQYATEAEMQAGQWQNRPCSKATCVISGLTPGIRYFCRIGVIGRKDQLVFSDVVSRVAA